VEDQQVVLNLSHYTLRQNGSELILAQDGEEGSRAFTEHIHEIDLILADVAMPKMHGIELVRRHTHAKAGRKSRSDDRAVHSHTRGLATDL
jgi:DNA-binding response OmpR family regulator